MFWNSLYAKEPGRVGVRRRRVRRSYEVPTACIPLLCKCVPRGSCQEILTSFIEWRQFEEWMSKRDSPTVRADPRANIRMQKAYDRVRERRKQEILDGME